MPQLMAVALTVMVLLTSQQWREDHIMKTQWPMHPRASASVGRRAAPQGVRKLSTCVSDRKT